MTRDPARQRLLSSIAYQRGTPSFVYFIDDVEARIAAINATFGNRFAISYAVKCNPNRELLRRLRGSIDLLDISSIGELWRSADVGWTADSITFTGPAKQESELAQAIDAGVSGIVLESVEEAEMLNDLAGQRHRQVGVLLRISPKELPRGFGINMAGKPCQFGIDEEEADAAVVRIQSLSHLKIEGLHIYSGTQCLKASAIVENYRIFIEIFRRLCEGHDIRPRKLIFGSGLGIRYHDEQSPLELAEVGPPVNQALDALKAEPRYRSTLLVLETGRYLVGEAGVYLTRILRLKKSRGAVIGICDGGMHHHLGACGHLGSVIHRNYQMFRVDGADDNGSRPMRSYDLVGSLCTTIDTLAHSVELPELEAGDIVAIEASGAYGVSSSPMHFISHPPPREILVDTVDGEIRVVDVTEFKASALPQKEMTTAVEKQ